MPIDIQDLASTRFLEKESMSVLLSFEAILNVLEDLQMHQSSGQAEKDEREENTHPTQPFQVARRDVASPGFQHRIGDARACMRLSADRPCRRFLNRRQDGRRQIPSRPTSLPA